MKSRVAALTEVTKRLAARIDKSARGANEPARMILSLMEGLERKAIALADMDSKPNPMDTPAARLRKMGKAAKKVKDEADLTDAKVLEIFDDASQKMAIAIDEKAGLVEGKYATEIREAFRGMTEEQRNITLGNALGSGNSEVIAAVCLAPAVLTGVSETVKNRYLDSIRKQKAPDLIEQFDELSEAFSTAGIAKGIASKIFDENYKAAELAKIDHEERESLAAELRLMGEP